MNTRLSISLLFYTFEHFTISAGSLVATTFVDLDRFLVVSVVECAVGDAKVCFQIVTMRILSIALQESQSSNPISLFHERLSIRYFKLLSQINSNKPYLHFSAMSSTVALAFAFF